MLYFSKDNVDQNILEIVHLISSGEKRERKGVK